MNDVCKQYRESLIAKFDAGLGLDDVALDHAADCAECRAYSNQMVALNAAFLVMPLEVPRNALMQRVKSRIASEPAYTNDARWWLPAAALCACTLLCIAVVYFALPVDPWTWWDYANETSATPQWMLGEVSLSREIASAQALWSNISEMLAPFSTPLLWTFAGLAALVLATVNGAEAYRLRTMRRS